MIDQPSSKHDVWRLEQLSIENTTRVREQRSVQRHIELAKGVSGILIKTKTELIPIDYLVAQSVPRTKVGERTRFEFVRVPTIGAIVNGS